MIKVSTENWRAWLTFLGSDEPEGIVQLITEYPEFKTAYEEVYNLCLNTEKVMGIFSEELKLLDQNTVQLMIDEMQQEIDGYKQTVTEQNQAMVEKDKAMAEKDKAMAEKDKTITAQADRIDELEKLLAQSKDK